MVVPDDVEAAVDGLGDVVIAPLVEDGFGVGDEAVEEVTTGLGMKNPWAHTLPHPSKQHLPDLMLLQSASDRQSS